jgi:pimeloyl-ACP methyl ester carboxylesterase
MRSTLNRVNRSGRLSRVTAAVAVVGAAMLTFGLPQFAAAQQVPAASASAPSTQVSYKTVEVDGIKVFYREAGPADAPALLLLHGFGASSFMFRELMPVLATKYRVIAPDLPGFGQTEVPAARNYRYSFANIAETMAGFTDAVGLKRYALYVFDYGAPTGFRLALRNPDRITAIISQNGNAYEEGLSPAWNPIQAYWKDPSAANRAALRGFLKIETTKWQYLEGVSDKTRVSPDAWLLTQLALDRPGNDEVQLDLFGDYASNVALYPKFQAYFRRNRPPFLAVWGDKDPFFVPAGARAYQRDLPDAQIRFFDAGHFALESKGPEITSEIMRFMAQVTGQH